MSIRELIMDKPQRPRGGVTLNRLAEVCSCPNGGMADASDLKSVVRKDVWVRIPLRVPRHCLPSGRVSMPCKCSPPRRLVVPLNGARGPSCQNRNGDKPTTLDVKILTNTNRRRCSTKNELILLTHCDHRILCSVSYVGVGCGLGTVAQWSEQVTHNHLVVGSSPTSPTKRSQICQIN